MTYYIVTAHTREGRTIISNPLTKSNAQVFVKRIKKEMRMSIVKYRWANDIRIEAIR